MSRKTIANQIMEVLSVGDPVYLSDGKRVRKVSVRAVQEEGILTSAGWLSYSSHRQHWWLTSTGARERW